MKELAIGEIGVIDGVRVECKNATGVSVKCAHCAFVQTNCNYYWERRQCNAECRSDYTDVYFKKIEE